MLVAEGELLVCVEAKFGSGNPLAHAGSVADGEKPIEREQLLRRYFDKAGDRTRRVILRDATSVRFHSQLFRNLVFASEMALDRDWHVVSLMSDTQRASGQDSKKYSFADPTSDIQAHLVAGSQNCFTYRSWEGLYRELVYDRPKLAALDSYMVSKSAHYIPAFRMNSG